MIEALRSVIARTSGERWEVVQSKSEAGHTVHRICPVGEPLVLFVEGPGIPSEQSAANAHLIITSKNLLPPMLDALELAVELLGSAQVFVDDESEARAADLVEKLALLGLAHRLLPKEFADEACD